MIDSVGGALQSKGGSRLPDGPSGYVPECLSNSLRRMFSTDVLVRCKIIRPRSICIVSVKERGIDQTSSKLLRNPAVREVDSLTASPLELTSDVGFRNVMTQSLEQLHMHLSAPQLQLKRPKSVRVSTGSMIPTDSGSGQLSATRSGGRLMCSRSEDEKLRQYRDICELIEAFCDTHSSQ